MDDTIDFSRVEDVNNLPPLKKRRGGKALKATKSVNKTVANKRR
jgi:hypothetical protein